MAWDLLAASNDSRDNNVMTKNILVTGATGTIGREVTKRLATQGASTRAGVRDRTKAREQFGDEIELMPFAFEDKRLFADALEDVEKVFLLPPLMPNQVEVTNAFVDAAQVPKGLKVLRIDGHLPGEKGYPLR